MCCILSILEKLTANFCLDKAQVYQSYWLYSRGSRYSSGMQRLEVQMLQRAFTAAGSRHLYTIFFKCPSPMACGTCKYPNPYLRNHCWPWTQHHEKDRRKHFQQAHSTCCTPESSLPEEVQTTPTVTPASALSLIPMFHYINPTLSTLSDSLKSTKPKPLDLPVMGSNFRVQSTTSPNLEK